LYLIEKSDDRKTATAYKTDLQLFQKKMRKLQKHFKHVAGRDETLKNGQDTREAVRAGK